MLLVVALCGCKKPVDPGPDLQIVDESVVIRSGDPVPRTSPYFDGARIALRAARHETLGIQVIHRGGGPVTLTVAGAIVHPYDVLPVTVTRPSTDMYGPSRGTGSYFDELVTAATPTTDPAYFEVVAGDAAGTFAGELDVAGRKVPVEVVVATARMPELPIGVWAEYNPKELRGSPDAPNDAERSCIDTFRRRGVLLAPPIAAGAYAARKELLAGSPIVPVDLPSDPAGVADAVHAWIAQTAGTGQVPFAIPIDEPGEKGRPRVKELARQVRDAGGGPGKFLFAVTDEPRTDYGDLIDLYIHLKPKLADTQVRWTYNGKPPRAGSMVVDTEVAPGPRTWGWIAWVYHLPIWYVWDALYWHDRYNRTRDQEMGRPITTARNLEPRHDATSFDNGSDHGNLDGVLALPGDDVPCHPTLRLERIRRGLEDRALLDLASACQPGLTISLANDIMPRALGDAGADAAWPQDPAAWEAARQKLLVYAGCR